MPDDILTKDRIHYLFEKLDDKLLARDQEATIFVVGGAALALTVNGERVTTDIDGQYENPVIDALTREMAAEEQLPADWLNRSIATTMSYFKKDTQAATVFNGKRLSIQAASPEYILAMKLASRREKDLDDVITIINKLKLQTKADILTVASRYFLADLSPKSWQGEQIEAFINSALEERHSL